MQKQRIKKRAHDLVGSDVTRETGRNFGRSPERIIYQIDTKSLDKKGTTRH